MHGNWQASVDARGEIARYFRSEMGEWFLQGYAKTAQYSDTYRFMRSQQSLVDNAEATYWVSDEVMDVVHFAAQSIPRTELHPDDLMTPSGFMLFENDIYMVDVYGKPLGFRAIAWMPMRVQMPGQSYEEAKRSPQAGIGFSLYGNKHAEKDWHMMLARHEYDQLDPPATPYEIAQSERVPHAVFPLWTVAHFDTWRFGDDFSDIEEQMRITLESKGYFTDDGKPAIPNENREVSDSPVYSDAEEMIRAAAEHAIAYRKLLLSIWVLMQQPIATSQPMRLSRQAEKRRERDEVTRDHPSRVQVITLRRAANPEPGHEKTGRKLQTRHIRRGFWRQQWYPTQGRHAPIWIESTVVGPEGAPLVNRHKVFEWTR